MKIHVMSAWTLLALEALFVLSLALQRNMGDDAAGRGMATGFAMLLAPIVLGAAALLWWGSRGGPAVAWWLGFCIVASPLAYTAVNFSTGMLKKIDRGLWRAQQGRFDDARLTELAQAIDAQDIAAMQPLLAAGPIDWAARDRWGRTLLGHAIDRALSEDIKTDRTEFVRLLLEAGAPAAANVLVAEAGMASTSAHNLVYHLYGVHNPNAMAVLDLVLAAGASADTVDEDGRPIYFSTYTGLPALEILARHGADFTRLDPRSDRLQHNALMSAVSMQMWAAARFFLLQGLSPDYMAPDGQSMRSLLAEADPPGSSYYGEDEIAHTAFIAELRQHPPPPGRPSAVDPGSHGAGAAATGG
nr:ankyrin repeat domain-containing protein [uncultured Roseateles sp.]